MGKEKPRIQEMRGLPTQRSENHVMARQAL
jgi:hypothetical protein